MGLLKVDVEYSVYESGRKAPQYTLDTDLKGELTLAELLEFTKSSLIVIADQVLKEEQARGFDKKPIAVVDGSPYKQIIDVNPLGKIEFFSKVAIDKIMLEMYESILERSPVDTGLYKSSNYVFINGTQIATNLEELKKWLDRKPTINPNDLIRFVNIQPYARRLERLGVTAQRQQSRTVKSRDKKQRSGSRILAPNGAYFLSFRSIKRKFKNNVGIRFNFISGANLGLSASFKEKPGSSAKVSTYLYPSISFLVSDLGGAE